MAMVLDAFVSFFVNRLGDLIEKEVRMQLGAEKDLRTLKRRLEGLQAFLSDAEKKKIGDESIRLWLGRLREVMYDADDLIDDYLLEADRQRQQDPAAGSSASRRPFLPSCVPCFRFRHEMGKRVADINGKLEEIAKDKPAPLQAEASTRSDDSQPWGGRLDRETSSQFDEDDVVGIDLEAKDLVDSLTRGCSSDRCRIFAIVGMAGIGKTTLAQKVYRDGRIPSQFEVKLWVCVSQDATVTKLLKAIIESAGIKDCSGIETRELLESKVREVVENKRFLLVLDDVWEGKIWDDWLKCPLQSGAANSRVLITTRSEDVARRMGRCHSHDMKLLPDDEGWRMLCKAFQGEEQRRVQKELRGIGMEIVSKCKGLPLAIKAVRGVLKGKNPSEGAWRRVLDSQLWDLPEKDLPKEIMPALYLSYEDLRPHLKQCFVYCSLFPEDFKFHKLNLVQMWVAEGFVKPEGGRAIADVADDYYRELVDRNLLQTVPHYFEDWGCKMHDMVRELALFVSKHSYMYRGSRHSGDAATRLRHLTIVGKGDSTAPEVDKNNESLRTLLLSRNPSIRSVPDDLFDKLRRLRVLDLSYTGIESLTDSVGNLIFLRFLNVSFTKLRELPEAIQYLRSLQTLTANGCKLLRRLPNGVARLLNLTHLTVADIQLDQMPTGIGKLRKLHSLYGFVASDRNQEGNNMKELKDLTRLRRLTMHRLGAVAGKDEAEAAVLRNKSNLEFLRLSCTQKHRHEQLEYSETQRIQEVFEGLLPPPSLESLHIDGFFGHRFPSWITKPSLEHLRWLRLEDCKLCEQLPPLGQFSQLRVLHLWNITSVSTIGLEFFSDGTPSGAPAFPLLEELDFRGMSKWTEWAGLEHGALPVLKKLHIVRCPRLRSLPEGLHHATSLRHLVIEGAHRLTAIENLPSISDLKITNNQILGVISNLSELKVMDISNCPSIREISNLDALDHLRLRGDMDSLPMWLAQITCIQRLDLTCSINLLRRCSSDGKDWHMICLLPRVEARSIDGSKYISYIRSPLSFDSNLDENNDSSSLPHSR